MNKQIAHIAKMKTPEPSGRFDVIKESGITADIMQAIFDVFQKSYPQTREFAKEFQLKCNCTHKILEKVWRFVKDNIKYKLDPSGTQLIKTPSVTIRDAYGDCKAYSILIASLLQNLQIPFVFRLVTYDPSNTDVTHIYVVAKIGKDEIPLDACLSKFGVEKKPYYRKIDKDMTKIIEVSGIGTPSQKPIIHKVNIDPNMNAGVLDLLLTREQLELERAIRLRNQQANKIGAINEDLAIINQALENVGKNQGIESIADFIGRRKPGGTKAGNFLRKVGKGIKTGVKAVAKTLTLPVRLAVKGILELKLPKAAYYFLPLFATEAQAQKIGASFVREQKRARKRANFIIKTIGMKENHFMKIVRNGIMKRKGKSPEAIVQALTVKGAKISGIGIDFVGSPILATQAASASKDVLAPLFELLTKLIELFKKKKSEEDLEITSTEASIFTEPNAQETPVVNLEQTTPTTPNAQTTNSSQNYTEADPSRADYQEKNALTETQTVQTTQENNNPLPNNNNNGLLIGAAVLIGLLALKK